MKLGLPALRTGIVVADEPIIDALAAFNATAALAPTSAGPALVEPLLRSGELLQLCESAVRPHYAALRHFAVQALREACAGLPLRIHEPEGAFFLWLWFPGLPIDSAELYRRLKHRGVLGSRATIRLQGLCASRCAFSSGICGGSLLLTSR